jgi:hypothetical protein
MLERRLVSSFIFRHFQAIESSLKKRPPVKIDLLGAQASTPACVLKNRYWLFLEAQEYREIGHFEMRSASDAARRIGCR